MRKIVSITYFDIEFDNRVKRTIHAAGSNWEKIIFYNSKKDYSEFENGVKFINIDKNPTNPYFRFLLIQFAFFWKLVQKRPRIVICNDIQPAPAVIFYKLLFLGYPKIIYDAHEMETMLYPKHQKIMSFLEWVTVKLASINLTINTPIAEYMNSKYHIETKIIANYPSIEDISKMERVEFLKQYSLQEEDKLILYTGVLLYNERGVEEVIQAMISLPENYKFLISAVGDIATFKSYVAQLCNDYQAPKDRVIFIGPYDESNLVKVVSFCHLSILLYNYRLNKNNDLNTPNKLYQAYVAGIPMLMCDNTSFKKITKESPIDIGKTVDPHDIEAIVATIKSILESPRLMQQKSEIGELGKNYLWESQFAKLETIVSGILN